MRSERENEEAGIGAWKEQQFRKGLLTRPSLDEEIQPAHMTGPEKKNKERMLSPPSPSLPSFARASRTIREIEGKTREPIDTTHTGQPPWEWSREEEKRVNRRYLA